MQPCTRLGPGPMRVRDALAKADQTALLERVARGGVRLLPRQSCSQEAARQGLGRQARPHGFSHQSGTSVPLGPVRNHRRSDRCDFLRSFGSFWWLRLLFARLRPTGSVSSTLLAPGRGIARLRTAEKALAAGYQLKRGAAKPLLEVEMEPGEAAQWMMSSIPHPFTAAEQLSGFGSRSLSSCSEPGCRASVPPAGIAVVAQQGARVAAALYPAYYGAAC